MGSWSCGWRITAAGSRLIPPPPASAAVWLTCGTGWRPLARPCLSKALLAPVLPSKRAGLIRRNGAPAWFVNHQHRETKEMSIRVAMVEDNDDLRRSMKSLLQRSPQLRVVADYPDAESALA